MDLFQFKQIEISKKYILSTGYYSMYRKDDFMVSNKIVALLNISEFDVPLGKSIIIDSEHGAIFDVRSTKRLIRIFEEFNPVGFALSKAFADLFDIKHYLPLINGYLAYMPIEGGSRRNTDWIALSLIKGFHQEGKVVHLETIQGYQFQIDFPKGNFENRVHEVALLCKATFIFYHSFVQVGLCDLQPPAEMGLLARYENCHCPRHLELDIKLKNLDDLLLKLQQLWLLNLGINLIERDEMIKYYRQNLARFKRNY